VGYQNGALSREGSEKLALLCDSQIKIQKYPKLLYYCLIDLFF
jgi:hypothetical protein